MSYLFDRTAKVIIGINDQEALVFDDNFRITFNVEKNISSIPTNSKISIYNLSYSTREKIKGILKKNLELRQKGQKELPLLLYAGYKEAGGLQLMYSGDITSVVDRFEPPNFITDIYSADGGQLLRDTDIQLSYAAGINSNRIIEQIAQVLKMDISLASDYLASNIEFANGYSFVGKAKDAMDKIAKDAGLKWIVEKGQILLTPLKKTTNETILEFSENSGLIGIPQKQEQQAGGLIDLDNYAGWKFQTLLSPLATPMRKVRIISREIRGDFMVNTVTHEGDLRGDAWTTSFETQEFSFT